MKMISMMKANDKFVIAFAYIFAFIFHQYYCNDVNIMLIEFLSFISYSIGAIHSCYVNQNGKLKCFGNNQFGQLGLGDTVTRGDQSNETGFNLPFVDIGNGLTVKFVVCGYAHTCVILNDDSAKCWGLNFAGQLGQGDTIQRGDGVNEMGNNLLPIDFGTGITPVFIAAGNSHNCVLFDNKKIKCFGVGSLGALGYGSTLSVGKTPSDMGNNLQFVNVGTNVDVASIYSSLISSSNCIIIDGSQLMKCWGLNDYGQLGYGDIIDRGDNANEMGDNLLTVDLGDEDRVKTIGMGESHTCAIRFDDLLKCFGLNDNGQLGIGSTTDATTMGNSLATTPVDSGSKKAKIVKGGEDHTCVLLNDLLTVKCVGNNDYGHLGQGDDVYRGDTPTNTMDKFPAINLGTGSLNILDIGAGAQYTCVVFVDYTIKCFGSGNYIGLGATTTVGDDSGEMGSTLQFVNVFGITSTPTFNPTTKVPSTTPTRAPTKTPVRTPTKSPTSTPTKAPSKNPTQSPTKSPTKSPSKSPSKSPTPPTTKVPSNSPVKAPTSSPVTKVPTSSPATKVPTTKSPVTKSPTSKTANSNAFSSHAISMTSALIVAMTMIATC